MSAEYIVHLANDELCEFATEAVISSSAQNAANFAVSLYEDVGKKGWYATAVYRECHNWKQGGKKHA